MRALPQLNKYDKRLVAVCYGLCMLFMSAIGLDMVSEGDPQSRAVQTMNSRPMRWALLLLAPIPVLGIIAYMVVGGVGLLLLVGFDAALGDAMDEYPYPG